MTRRYRQSGLELSRFRRRLPLGHHRGRHLDERCRVGGRDGVRKLHRRAVVVALALYESVSESNAGVSVATSPTNDSAESFGDAPADATRHGCRRAGRSFPMEPAGAAVATSGATTPSTRAGAGVVTPSPRPASSRRHERCTPPPRTLSAHFAHSNGQAKAARKPAHFLRTFYTGQMTQE